MEEKKQHHFTVVRASSINRANSAAPHCISSFLASHARLRNGADIPLNSGIFGASSPL